MLAPRLHRAARPAAAPPPALAHLPAHLPGRAAEPAPVAGLDEVLAALLAPTPAPPDPHRRPLQGVYADIEAACALSDDAAAALCARTHTRLKRAVEALVHTLGTPPARTDRTACAQWATRLGAAWTTCAARLGCVAQLVAPLTASAWYVAHAPPPLEAVCFAHWAQQVRAVPQAQDALVQGVVALADRARREAVGAASPTDAGAADADAPDPPDALAQLLALGTRMGLGEALHAALRTDAHAYATELAAGVFADADAAHLAAGLARIAACLARERQWAPWLYATDAAAAVDAAQAALVTAHVDALVRALPVLLDRDEERAVAQGYALLRDADALGALRPAWAAYVHDAGARIVRGADEPLIAALLALLARLQRVVRVCFAGDAAMTYAMRDSFEACVNAAGSRPAELLARYADAQLRAGNRVRSDAELDACMTQVLALFRLLRDKDMFEEFYKRCFAKRLLLARSASDDAERAMLLKLKDECGPDFTAQLETMLKDVQLSDGLMAAYADRRAGAPFDFEARVLTQAHWPTFPDTPVALPAALQDELGRFAAFYHTCHSGRTLHWRHALGFLLLTADLGAAGTRELHVSTFQAAVLLAFNGAARGAALSYTALAAATQLPAAELRRTLQSLACGPIPTRVLRKHPPGRDVHDSDTFVVNEALKNERRRIRINQIQHKDTREEQRSTEQRVFIDRELLLQAAAMRVLKARKTIAHAELTTEVVHQIKNRFAVDAAELKRAFERLIDKDCMERVEGQRGVYRYVA
ncbi:hypothetical protein MBRA1_002712 [Malassezia brasiliensis]|uniref:Cullin family profile domain-containing protein n=1 Tax=Malassezia brasiliensis TaxID=1821822 RepID=A0AAF0DWC1_9BASI|nr:hypothetical protein MBRA1_002712 [Malassezia brasiliensis]